MSCKDICTKYTLKKHGYPKCTVCEVVLDWDGVRCPCCSQVLVQSISERRRKSNAKMRERRKQIRIQESNNIYHGNCLKHMKLMPDNYVNLVMTSPPYGNARKRQYNDAPLDTYAPWFLPMSQEIYRILKPNGSFVLNIKERATGGQRGTYVIELILEMKKQGWMWVEEYMWHKTNSYPGKWPNRFRDAYERILHFTKQKRFYMDQDSVMVPAGDWLKDRLKTEYKNDTIRAESGHGNNLTKNISNWKDRTKVYPTNVLHGPTVCHNVSHPAAYPAYIPEHFIKLFTRKNQLVLDPFVGSGTTAVVAKSLGRKYVGIDSNLKYCQLARENLKKS